MAEEYDCKGFLTPDHRQTAEAWEKQVQDKRALVTPNVNLERAKRLWQRR